MHRCAYIPQLSLETCCKFFVWVNRPWIDIGYTHPPNPPRVRPSFLVTDVAGYLDCALLAHSREDIFPTSQGRRGEALEIHRSGGAAGHPAGGPRSFPL